MHEQRVAVVTGASRGIGQAVTKLLAGSGHRVIAVARDQLALDAVVVEVAGDVTALACDVGDESMVAATIGSLPRVDVLVNNAGAATSNPVHRTSLAQWEEMLRVNATGVFLCTRAVLSGMRERDWGRIVTVASVAGHSGGPYTGAYAASKHAAIGLMRVVAAEVRGSGVTSNAVCPSYVRTPMTERTLAGIAAHTGGTTTQAETLLLDATATGRLIEPDEVAAAVAYLVSPLAAAVNGQSIVIDGGGLQL